MSAYPMDDVLDAESDLRHLNTLIEVATDMAIDAACLSPGTAPSDRAKVNALGDMMWIARDLCGTVTKNLQDATERLVAERKAQRDTKAAPTADLRGLIEAYAAAKSAWEAIFDKGQDQGPERNAWIAAETAIITLPCNTLDEVRAKVRFFLEHPGVCEEIRAGCTLDKDSLVSFLHSLLGEGCAA